MTGTVSAAFGLFEIDGGGSGETCGRPRSEKTVKNAGRQRRRDRSFAKERAQRELRNKREGEYEHVTEQERLLDVSGVLRVI